MNDQSTILDGCGVKWGIAMHLNFFRRMRAASIRMHALRELLTVHRAGPRVKAVRKACGILGGKWEMGQESE
jgi:hypothetical protein